jgi:hypothetical protein
VISYTHEHRQARLLDMAAKTLHSRKRPQSPAAKTLHSRKRPQSPGQSVPAAIARYSVLIEPGGAIPLTVPPFAAYTIGGFTADFDVFYESTLGSGGQALADAILGRCEQDLSQLRGFFGGVSAGRFSVFIDKGTFGAYHFSCAATGIHCAAYETLGDGDLENFLNCAEVDEVLMAAQAKGWDCGASAGEGLSRVLATELHPASLGGFASASYWLNSARPDWVTQTEGTDRHHVSIGCATLFINYLRYQLHFSLAQIVQAAGTTLQQTYERLTGSTDAFGPFASLLEAAFPPGVTVDLPNDNPFPLSEVPDVMNEPAKLAGKDVLLSGLVPKFTGAGQQNSFVNSQSPIAGKVVSSGSIVSMNLVQGEPP